MIAILAKEFGHTSILSSHTVTDIHFHSRYSTHSTGIQDIYLSPARNNNIATADVMLDGGLPVRPLSRSPNDEVLENKDVPGVRFSDSEPGLDEKEPGWIRVSRERKVNRMSGESKLIL